MGVDLIKVSEFGGTEQKTDRPPDETLVALEIPDMVDSDDHPGAQGIAPGATVTVVFRQTAGIKNPTESKADEVTTATIKAAVSDHDDDPDTPMVFDPSMLKMLSGYKVQVASSNNGYFVTAPGASRAVIARRIILSGPGRPPRQHHHGGGPGLP